MPPPEDDRSSLERARERLYAPSATSPVMRDEPVAQGARTLPHAWKEALLPRTLVGAKRHVRLATLFFGAAIIFFILSLLVAVGFFYFGGNVVSVSKISIDVAGPTSIAGGDIVPLSLSITNKNPVAIDNATIEISFPVGTRDAVDVLKPYPRYTENLGSISSGGTVNRSIKAVVFGATGETLTLPLTLSYTAAGSRTVFAKKLPYSLVIASTPLSVSVDTVRETVSGKPLTLTLAVRSNATVPIDNVVLTAAPPFGFTVTASSIPLTSSGFFIGTLAPGASKTVKLTGTLEGQEGEQRVFHFTLGTARSKSDQMLAVTYMTQDASVAVTAPFITTTLAINGDTSSNVTITPGSTESVTFSYLNTLPTTVSNATIAIQVSGSAVDYGSIETSSGFYRSQDHMVLFSRDTDSSLETLAPGASGVGSFTFKTLPVASLGAAPTITFSISVAGTRVGQTNVPEEVTASTVKTIKVVAGVVLSAASLHSSGPLPSSGPIPPVAGEATTYAIGWSVRNSGSAIAGGSVSATLPSYVTYTEQTIGSGSFSYDRASRTVTWSPGDLTQGKTVTGSFQVSLTPSTSQRGTAPALTGAATFKGYDRFAGVQVSATASEVTTETTADPGYVSSNSIVQ